MPSIINGLFAGRSGISSHGNAIAVVGDNISNASTIGFKASRSEFEDIIAGGQTSGKVVGSGSSTSAVSTIFEQGSTEFTGRNLDLAVDGNGFFVVQDANSGEKYYTRAGNFRVDESGNIVDNAGRFVLGYPDGGNGSLEPVNINNVSQSSIASQNVVISGNLNADPAITTTTAAVAAISAPVADGTNTIGTDEYSDLNTIAEFQTVVDVFDSLGAKHTLTLFFFHTASNQYTVRAYADSTEVDPTDPPPTTSRPMQISTTAGTAAAGTFTIGFDSDGSITTGTTTSIDFQVPWNNGSTPQDLTIDLSNFTQYASPSNITSIAQDGQGVGTIGSISINPNGDIFAVLDNGSTSVIGTIGLVNFSNPEGLTRIGGNLLQQSPTSGEPISGIPGSGTFGALSPGSLELSTVDIASEFVKLITLQRGFQANSRIITTINQLLNEIIQLA